MAATSKPHLLLLDALRGVAALIVIWYHSFEGFATSVVTQSCNHGYLAVDFFFILSGFVIGYAYDERFRSGGMKTGEFFKRRLIRLHPMVVFGVLFGVLAFVIGGRVNWAGETAEWRFILVAMLLNLFLLPVIPGQRADVRGNGEMFPLNGPHWSLFFEYIGNILYVLLLRRLSNKALAAVTAVTGFILAWITIRTGYLGIGWTLPDFWGGLVRVLFPYSAGMLLSRFFLKREAEGRAPLAPAFLRRHAFLFCALILLLLLPMPFVGSGEKMWTNGLYVVFIVMVLFPAIIWTAAEGSCDIGGQPRRLYTFLGDLSYPLYAVHYPLMYLFYQYIGFPSPQVAMADVWPVALGVVALSIAVAVVAMYCYDKPVRRWLSSR